MRDGKFIILVVFVLLVSASIGIHQFQQSRHGPTPAPGVTSLPAPAPGRPLTPAVTGQFRGFSLQLQSPDPRHPYEKYIQEIAATGANTVCMVLAAYQENCTSTSIFIEARKAPSDERVRKLILHAHALGLRVVIMPIVLLENPGTSEWRGKINPENWDDWWEDYNNYILHYARIAQAAKVEVFMVGSELVSTEKDQADHWRELIRRVRGCYKGYLSYSANWDHYRPVSWWKDLDIIGMTTYYDLTEGKKPTVQRLLASWRPIRQEILAWQKRIGRPILFTEVGWPNQTTCAQYPWDYTRSPDKPDPTAQANCFDAFFQTWIDEPAAAGFLVWEWRNHPRDPIGPEDTGYSPCGKPAMEVIKRHYQTPGGDGPTSLPATAPAATSASAPTSGAADE